MIKLDYMMIFLLPDTVVRSALAHPLLEGLLVTHAGLFPQAKGHRMERSAGTTSTILIFCSSGSGWIQLGEEAPCKVEAGSLAWLPAGRPHSYGAVDAGEPWTIEWVHVTGSEVAAWAELLQLPVGGGVLFTGTPVASAVHLGNAWEYLERGYSLVNLVSASAALRAALAHILQLRMTQRNPGGSSAQQRVAASAEWMKAHFTRPLRLNELATRAGLSAPHYSMLFRQMTGYAPIDWLIRLRIQYACQLLATTDTAIRTIGELSGFPDAYYFTRCFRRIMEMSPRTYRNMPKG